MDGVFELTIKDKTRKFFLGSYAFMLCSKNGLELNDMRERLEKNIWETTALLAYAAAFSHSNLIAKEEPDYTLEDVYLWIDEVGVNVMLEHLTKQMEAYTVKNLKAPAAGQSGQYVNI